MPLKNAKIQRKTLPVILPSLYMTYMPRVALSTFSCFWPSRSRSSEWLSAVQLNLSWNYLRKKNRWAKSAAIFSDSQPLGLRFYIKMQMSWRRSVEMIDRQGLGNTAGVPSVEKIKLSICLNGRNSQYEKYNLQILVPSSFSFQKYV